MTGLYRDLKTWGVDEARLHFEFFGPRQDITSVKPEIKPTRPLSVLRSKAATALR